MHSEKVPLAAQISDELIKKFSDGHLDYQQWFSAETSYNVAWKYR